MKIVLGGYIVGFPVGGMTWHHLHYLLGLVALGHEVTFLEDGANHPPLDPTKNAEEQTADPSYGLAHLRRTFETYGLKIPWHYRYGYISEGLSNEEMRSTLRDADLFIAVSGVTPIDWYDLPKRTLVIDTDPVFTQLRMRKKAAVRKYYGSFSHVATFGRLIGTPASTLPTHGFDWIPTNQPVFLPAWPAKPVPTDGFFSTVGKWEHDRKRSATVNGETFASSKGVEYERLIDLPSQTDAKLEMRMAGLLGREAETWKRHGWHLGDALAATVDCPSYETYIAATRGEFTVAKQIYAGLPSGWFSDRSACFLAAGRPVVTQASGFDQWLPTGEGLFSFNTKDEAAAALAAVLKSPQKHGNAARSIAERHFDSKKVLGELLERTA